MSDYIIVHGIRVAQNFVPETFGRLTTIGPRFLMWDDKLKRRRSWQVCVCTCGLVRLGDVNSLRTGNTKSCGCQRKETQSNLFTTHGMSDTPEYSVWYDMTRRCYNTSASYYESYGGRGIRVCDRWLEPETGFINFLSDMGERPSPKHSIDRIDVNGNYCPENCRWATLKEQARNTRRNHMLTCQGRTQCITAWAEEFGVSTTMIKYRMSVGWTAVAAITTPSSRPKKVV